MLKDFFFRERRGEMARLETVWGGEGEGEEGGKERERGGRGGVWGGKRGRGGREGERERGGREGEGLVG